MSNEKLSNLAWKLIDELEKVRAQPAGESDWRSLNQADVDLRQELEESEAIFASKPEPEVWGVWIEGEPPNPWRDEWFIAETIYGERVVLRHMGEGLSYDYKTADETYMLAKNIKRWMQFPDGGYISAASDVIAKKDTALQAQNEVLEKAEQQRDELLAALQQFLPEYHLMPGRVGPAEAMVQARTAIAKVNGGAA